MRLAKQVFNSHFDCLSGGLLCRSINSPPGSARCLNLFGTRSVNRGYGPTVREIGDKFRISSPNGVMCHLKALEKKGLITREPNMSRAIQITEEYKEDRRDAAGRSDRGRQFD